MHKTQFFSRGI